MVQQRTDGELEVAERGVVLRIQDLLLGELPQALNEVQVRGIRWQEEQLDAQGPGGRLDQFAMLISSVVQYHRDRSRFRQRGQFAEQLANALGVDVAGVADRYQLVGGSTEGSQDIETLPSGVAADEQAGEAPEPSEKGRLDEVGGIHEVDPSLTSLRLLQPWLKIFFLNSSWASGSALAGTAATFRNFIPMR